MDARCEEALEVQSILFQRDKWSFFEALQWIEENPEFTVEKADLTEDYIRIRQHDPDLFDKTSFRTITFSERKGIKAITACPRGNYRRANPRRRIPIKVAADAYVGTDTAMIVVIAPERLSELREWPHSSADWSEYEAFEESVKAAGGDIIYTGADGEWGVELMFPNRYHNPRFTKDTFLDPSQGGVNMTVQELRAWAKDPRHKLASTAVGHYSLTRIPELVQKPERSWTEDDYEWAQKVVNFNHRHLQQVVKAHEERGGKGGFGREVGRSGYSKRHIALLNWGHDPGKEDSPAFEADAEWQEGE